MAKKITYVNNGAAHRLKDGTVVPRGATFESDDPDICKKFPGKFTVAGADEPVNATDDEPSAASTSEPSASASSPAKVDERGENVTGDFNLEGDEEKVLAVFKAKKGWNVYEGDDADALNEKPLKKGKVQAFIDDYLAED